jgi:hypothetical protein
MCRGVVWRRPTAAAPGASLRILIIEDEVDLACALGTA